MNDQTHDTGLSARLSARLSALRETKYAWLVALALGIAFGSLVGSLHWGGIFVGGAIAGLGQRSITRGIGAGAVAGLGIWVVFLGSLQLDAAAMAALGSMPIIAVSLAIAVAYGAFGGLLRGVL